MEIIRLFICTILITMYLRADGRIQKSKEKQIKERHPRRVLRLSDDDLLNFKKRNTVSNSTTIDLQSISENNSIIFRGIEYSLDGLEQYSIVAQGDKKTSPLWRKEIGGTKMTVIKIEGIIIHIFIMSPEGRGDIMYINTDEVTKQPIYGTITDTDYDEDRLKLTTKNGEAFNETRMKGGDTDTIESSAENTHALKNETAVECDTDTIEGSVRNTRVLKNETVVECDTDTVEGSAGNAHALKNETVADKDNDEEKLQSAKKTVDAYDELRMKDGDKDTFVGSIENARPAKATKCTTPKIIEVAIAHDASFCKKFGGNKQRTDSHIQAVVGLASSYYEPVCINLQLTYIDGTCNSGRDTYSSIAKSKLILEEFTEEWKSKKQNVRRDVAHLFSGSSFDQGILGWAWKKTVCSKANGYGANWLAFTENIALQASLFAHELGHNAGAAHFGGSCSNWLMAPCGSGLSGFSEESLGSVMEYLDTQTCLEKNISLPSPPTNKPNRPTNKPNRPLNPGFNPDTSFFFPTSNSNNNRPPNINPKPFFSPSINTNNRPSHSNPMPNPSNNYSPSRNNNNKPTKSNPRPNTTAPTGTNITPVWHISTPTADSNTSGNGRPTQPSIPTKSFEICNVAVASVCLSVDTHSSKIYLKTCDDSSKQQWTFNTRLGTIQSLAMIDKCMTPAKDNSSNKRTRLVIQTCPQNIIEANAQLSFQWTFYDGQIRSSLDYTVIEATRALKKSGGSEEVVVIPTMSKPSGSDFQKWSRSSDAKRNDVGKYYY